MSALAPLRHAPPTPGRGARAARALRAFFGGAEEGQALIIIALTMLGMIFGAGLAIDSGQLFSAKRSAQEAADAGAFAGATVLNQGGTTAQATNAANADASLNGYSANVPTSGTTVTVNIPPTSGAFSGNSSYVEVVIVSPVRTSLVPQQATFTNVRARAVAGNVSMNSGYAVMALDQTCAISTLSLSSNGELEIAGGGVMVNSCSAPDVSNSGQIEMQSPYCLDMVGGSSAGGSVTGCQRTGRPVAADPFAGLAKPSTNGLSTYTPACAPTINQPGIYTSTFGSNCAYIVAPGTYILKGGGIDLQGNSSMCTGTSCSTPTAAGGVFFYLTYANYPTTGGSCATFALNGNNVTTLSAPTSGTYAGMLFWQDAACTYKFSIGGGASINATGTVYVPGAKVEGNGNHVDVEVSQIVAKQVDTQNAEFEVTYSSVLSYQGSIPALVE